MQNKMTNKPVTIYIFSSSYFPKKGWIQNCFWCALSPTSDVSEFPKNELLVKTKHKIKVHICPTCRDRLNTEEYNQAINLYLKNHLHTG